MNLNLYKTEFCICKNLKIVRNEIIDPEHFNLTAQKPITKKSIISLSYDIILNLNKGTTYEGVVKINVQYQKNKGNSQNLIIDFNGKSLLYLGVNDRKINEEDVIF